jgi:hypothetical protein
MNHKKIIKKIKKATLDRPLEIWFLYRQRKKKRTLGVYTFSNILGFVQGAK